MKAEEIKIGRENLHVNWHFCSKQREAGDRDRKLVGINENIYMGPSILFEVETKKCEMNNRCDQSTVWNNTLKNRQNIFKDYFYGNDKLFKVYRMLIVKIWEQFSLKIIIFFIIVMYYCYIQKCMHYILSVYRITHGPEV